MIILADENIEKPLVICLRELGHEVIYIVEESPGIPDNEVLAEANTKGAVLLTSDKDFGELVYRQKLVSNGICLLRLAGLSAGDKQDIISAAFEKHGEEMLNAFSVITSTGLRIRK